MTRKDITICAYPVAKVKVLSMSKVKVIKVNKVQLSTFINLLENFLLPEMVDSE